jgi:hypothetical protein
LYSLEDALHNRESVTSGPSSVNSKPCVFPLREKMYQSESSQETTAESKPTQTMKNGGILLISDLPLRPLSQKL